MSIMDFFKAPNILTLSVEEFAHLNRWNGSIAETLNHHRHNTKKFWQVVTVQEFNNQDVFTALKEAFPLEFLGEYEGGEMLPDWMDIGFQYDVGRVMQSHMCGAILARKYPKTNITFRASGQ